MNKLEILYEDNHIIVVLKPCNILSQSDDTKDIDMLTIIKDYLKEKYNKPGNVFLGLVHRLDRPVSGIMVYAKTSKAASRLSEQVRNNQMSKHYLAIIKGILPEKKGELRDYLKKDNNFNSVVSNSEDGKESILEYNVLKEIDNLSLVEINLITGRHHQIRVQFASRGYPLYGDQRYGLQDKEQIALFSNYLSFIHPTTKEKLEFSYNPSKSGVWNLFL